MSAPLFLELLGERLGASGGRKRGQERRGESAIWNRDLGHREQENIFSTWFLHPARLLGMKTAVERVSPFHFPLKQSCIPSKLLNIYLNILPIIKNYLPYSRGCFVSPIVQELSSSQTRAWQALPVVTDSGVTRSEPGPGTS